MNKTATRWVLGLALVLAIAFALAWRDRFDDSRMLGNRGASARTCLMAWLSSPTGAAQ